MPRLTDNQRHEVMGMLAGGLSQREIARRMGCSPSTIVRLHQRYVQTGSLNERPRPGRQRVTSDRQDHYIRVTHLRYCFQTAPKTVRTTKVTVEFACGDGGERVTSIRASANVTVGVVAVSWCREGYPSTAGRPLLSYPVDILQQDNARAHSARLTIDFLNQQNIQTLPWPAFSPEYSPIEHFWDQLGQAVKRRQPQNRRELEITLQEEWRNIQPVHAT
ncbi:uncharacterized protein [Argopecten irradians]|uniref:uncharacterized protein n=1 Tax=Argopecten irradians TaxID=31199 RepID=UPI003717A704